MNVYFYSKCQRIKKEKETLKRLFSYYGRNCLCYASVTSRTAITQTAVENYTCNNL